MWRLYIMMLVIVIPISFYLYRFFKRMGETFGLKTEKKNTRIGIGVFTFCLSLLCMNIFGIGAILVLHIVVSAMFIQFINFIVKIIAKEKYEKGCKIWKKIYGSGIVPIVITLILIVYGYINMHNVVETDYTIYTEKEIRDEGYRVLLISDVHFGISLDCEELQLICNEAGKKNPDIVILCGDIVDDKATKEEMENVFRVLGSINNRYGIFYVYGNHDRQLYSSNRAYTEEELANIIDSNGINILQDEIHNINDEFIIAGREDHSYSRENERKTIDEVLESVSKDDFILTLDHQPKEYEENGKAGTDLLLSGHTHGGQIWPAQFLFALAKFDDAVYGHTYIDKDTQAIVTSGLAGWGYPVKTAAPAEYVMIDIKHK